MSLEPLDLSSTGARRNLQATRGRRRRYWIAAALLVALVAHWAYWYSPRERPVEATAPFLRLLEGEGSWDRVLWIAYPHQNLGAVDEALGSLEDYLAELARVAEIDAPRLPRFGPFAVPPARELALAWNDEGGELLGVARIYRGLGIVARLAGRLAGNPWLAGGRAKSGGREYVVSWEGPLWVVRTANSQAGELQLAEPASAASPASATARGPLLAEARLARPTGPVAPGNFQLARHEDGIEIRGGDLPGLPGDRSTGAAGEADGEADTLRLDLPQLALWVATADRGPVGGPGLFLLWEEKESIVPRVATLQRGGGRAFKLPGESLLELVGKADPEFRLGWVARGTDSRAKREALRIVPWLERHYPRASDRERWLAAAGRLAPRRAAGMIERLASRLRAIPLIPAAEVARVEAGALLLKPLADCSRLTFEVWRNPDGVRVRLCPRSAIEQLSEDRARSGEWVRPLQRTGKLTARPDSVSLPRLFEGQGGIAS